MWVGASSTSFTLQAWSCENAQDWGKPVIANPTVMSLTLGLAALAPGNYYTGVPCLATPNCKPILPNLRKWTLDPLLLYPFCEYKDPRAARPFPA